MSNILWFVLTFTAGTAAILGSFMALGGLILWFAPSVPVRSRKPEAQPFFTVPLWQNQIKLLAFSVAIASTGVGILVVLPFPSF